MTLLPSRELELECHPSSVRPPVRGIRVRLSEAGAGALRLSFTLEGDITRLRVPPLTESVRRDELWRHTCFEAFVAPGEGPAYCEINLSPSSEWALYRFDAYRQGMKPLGLATPPAISVRHSEHRLELDARIPLESQSTPQRGAPRIALAAIVESDEGVMSYWALRHAPGKPDFHHPAAFMDLSTARTAR